MDPIFLDRLPQVFPITFQDLLLLFHKNKPFHDEMHQRANVSLLLPIYQSIGISKGKTFFILWNHKCVR